jgi:hypothetical protein
VSKLFAEAQELTDKLEALYSTWEELQELLEEMN